ncbi:hypothetical protein D3C71_1350530 [compost metagenome]
MFTQSASPAENMTFHNINHVTKRQLFRNVTRLLFYTYCTNPFLRNDNPKIFSFLNGTISRSLTDQHFFCKLTNRYFGAYLKTFNMLQQLLVFSNCIALTFQLLHPRTPICTILYSLYTERMAQYNRFISIEFEFNCLLFSNLFLFFIV